MTKSQRTLLLIALVSLAPVIGGYLAFWLWTPAAGTTAYGELLPAAAWQPGPLSTADGQPFDAAALKRQWVLVYADSAQCAEACRKNLWTSRQVRAAQGKEMDRIRRVWLLDDAAQPEPALLAEHPDLLVLRASAGAATPGRIELLDPLGNRMMRFPAEPEPKRMVKDLERLLKYSRIG